ncbi:hypothetical protein QTP88_018057 [Uroleucon formosanum]
MEQNYFITSSESNHYYSNPISAFQKTILDIVKNPESFDVSTVFSKTQNYVKNVIEHRRSGETPDTYKVRVFAELLTRSKHDNPSTGTSTEQDLHLHDLVLYAREAAESGYLEKARRLYLRLIILTESVDPAYWILYGAFCARDGDLDAALVCARRAVALDGHDRFSLFAHAAALMTANTDHYDELETLLDSLASAHPRFSEGHSLAAIHYHRMVMRNRADRSLSLAMRFADDGRDDEPDDGADRVLRIGLAAVWEPITGGGDVDPAVKCAVLLCRLELVDLAATCLRCFAATRADPYHYMMAVTHYRREEYQASADHLDSMVCRRSSHDGDGGLWTLLAAHVDYGAGHLREAMIRYIELSLVPDQARYGLAYSRVAGHFAATRRYAEAADAYHRACAAIPVPALMIKLATCLVALDRYAEAERLLVSAVAADGTYEGDGWHQLAMLYAITGNAEMADVCRRRVAELGTSPRSLAENSPDFRKCHTL